MNDDSPEEKVCALPGCEELFTRPSHISRKVFAERKYHSSECRSKARSANSSAASQAPSAVFGHRYNSDGVWRPNAPGFPDLPGNIVLTTQH